MISSALQIHRPAFFLLSCIVLLASTPILPAQSTLSWGASIRGYQVVLFEDSPIGARHDAELGILRLTGNLSPTSKIKLETHAVFELLSPPLAGFSLATASRAASYLPLEHFLVNNSNVALRGSFDRLNLQFNFGKARIVLGRQAIAWGVSYFWPAMDLFAPFAPERIDRDYKPGVDALRFTIPLTVYSEIDIVGGSLGSSPSRDWGAGLLSRIHAGPVDFGFMGGRFHQDNVGGAFFTSNLRGIGFRGEWSWTQSGDPQDRQRGRERFARGTIGVDRQLTPSWRMGLEFSWNGYGMANASRYLTLIAADRILRGEVNALGQVYSGIQTAWQIHPLWAWNNAVLVNWKDPSSLWISTFAWSTGNNSEVLFGAQLGLGKGLQSGLMLGSEYGSIPNNAFVSFKKYF